MVHGAVTADRADCSGMIDLHNRIVATDAVGDGAHRRLFHHPKQSNHNHDLCGTAGGICMAGDFD